MADGRLKRAKLSFERNFTQIPNEWLRDGNLSLKARGLLALLMSHDEGFTVTHKQLADTNPEGREAIETAVRELKEQGYLELLKTRGRNGRIEGWVWELTDPVEVLKRRSEPLPGFPDYGLPVRRSNRTTENPHLKEQQSQEQLTQVLKTGDGTRAGVNEDASGDSHHVASESADERYSRLLHQPCPYRAGKEHDFTPDAPCTGCGIRVGQYWDRGDIRQLSDLLAVQS